MRMFLAAAVLAVSAMKANAAGLEDASGAAQKSFQKASQAGLTELLKSAAPAPQAPPKREILPVSHRHRNPWDRDRGDRGWGRRDQDCRAYDRGWEEHWGGHGGRGFMPGDACRECLGRHGGCTYRCTEEAYRCTAEWQAEDGTRREYEGRTRRDRYDAEDDAVNRCRDDNWRNRDQGRCRPLRCDSTDEVVDSGRC